MKNKQLVEVLIAKGYKISFAESCTGGYLASSIIEVSGASQVIDMSFVTYSNESKIKLVDVLKTTIDKYGVVSEQVGLEMAIGAAKKASANIGVGITGNAGPTTDDRNNPVGMVCFGFFIDGDAISITKNFGNIGRNKVREAAVNYVFDVLLEKLGN